jgi:hypothetical protein
MPDHTHISIQFYRDPIPRQSRLFTTPSLRFVSTFKICARGGTSHPYIPIAGGQFGRIAYAFPIVRFSNFARSGFTFPAAAISRAFLRRRIDPSPSGESREIC